MLSAIEQIGPATGPAAVGVLPYAYHHNSYAIAAAAATVTATAAKPSVTTTAVSSVTTTQDLQQFHAHKVLNAKHIQQQQAQQQQQTHLSYLETPASGIANLTLLSPPLSSASSTASSKSLQHAELNGLQSYKHQRSDQSEASQLIMSTNEFTRPRQNATTISIHPLPLQQSNLSLNFKNGYCNPTAYTVQNYSSYTNDQSAPINLVTSSNGFTNSLHQSRRSPSPSSSVDVENDDSMSPIPIHAQPFARKPIDQMLTVKQASPSYEQTTISAPNSSGVVASVAANYPVDFSNFYASRTAAIYGAPIFHSHHASISAAASHCAALRSHANYLNAMPAMSALPPTQPPPTAQLGSTEPFSVAYLKAIQNAAVVASIFNPTTPTLPQQQPQAQPQPQSQQQLHSPLSTATASQSGLTRSVNILNTKSNSCQPIGSMSAPAPPPGPRMVSHNLSSSSTQNDLRYKTHADEKINNHSFIVTSDLNNGNRLPSSGTYLNDKVSSTPSSHAVENFFKVPSGKEGSLKHRILTRPTNAEKGLEANKTHVMSTHNCTSNFRKGSCIELFNGVLRKVEDMRTEDFIKCAERSVHHQLVEATVVKINSTSTGVLITFSYNKNRSKADIEITPEYPFFVYGQGWASCCPEMSLTSYGLKCQRLQVGDICISLSERETTNTPNNVYSIDGDNRPRPKVLTNQACSATTNIVTPTTLSTSHLSVTAQYHNLPNVSMHLLPTRHMTSHHPVYVDVADMTTIGSHTLANPHIPNVPNSPHQPPLHLSRPLLMHTVQRYVEGAPGDTSYGLSHGTRLGKNTKSTKSDTGDEQIEPVDASLSAASRKRRWSAPESICDNDNAIEGQSMSLAAVDSRKCKAFISSS